MSTTVAVIGGVGAAAFFAAGTALQYRAVRNPGSPGDIGVRSVILLARTTVSSPRWFLGTALLVAGLGLHALALHEGSLTLVQPLLATGVLFALPSSSRVGGPPVTVRDMQWAAVLVAALATFLVTAAPVAPHAYNIDKGPAVVTLAVAFVGISACVGAARHRRGATAALLLGVASGIALAGSAALLKVCTNLVARGFGTLLTSWQLYALAAVGTSGLVLSQLAYRSAPMVASLPAIHATNPLVSLIIGTTVLDEHFRAGIGAVTIEGMALAVVLTATVALSRRSSRPYPDAGDRRTPTGLQAKHNL